MARKARPEFVPGDDWPTTVVGRKYVRMLEGFIGRLRSATPHPNRKVHLDDVFTAYLLAFFNASVRSLRTIEDFSQSRQAQKVLSVGKLCRSTLSDLNRAADPTLLEPLIRALHAQLPPGKAPEGLEDVLRTVYAVDGSFFAVAADVAWAVRHRKRKGRGNDDGTAHMSVRLDVHLNVATGLPEIIDVCGAGVSEPKSAAAHIKPGSISVYDRAYFDFDLIRAHAEHDAEFVVRMRADGERTPKFEAAEERRPADPAKAAGVRSDRLGRLAGSTHRAAPDLLLREVVIVSPDEPAGEIRLLTDIMDLDAEIIGLIYKNRWQVELFFRWLKVFSNFEHLISRSRNGILLNFYVAVIGVLLMYLHTGSRPSKYAFALLAGVAAGGSTLEDIEPILRERQRQIDVANARIARKRAEAQAAKQD